MATIEKITGKTGATYRITVSGGFDTQGKRIRHRMTYKPEPGMTARQTEKAVQRAAADFERSIEQGFALDNRQTFADYAAYVIDLKERTGTKHRTIEGYKRLLIRTNQAIGHMAIQDIRAVHLNRFYKNLAERGIRATAPRERPQTSIWRSLTKCVLGFLPAAKLLSRPKIGPKFSRASQRDLFPIRRGRSEPVPWREVPAYEQKPPRLRVEVWRGYLYLVFCINLHFMPLPPFWLPPYRSDSRTGK